MKVTTIFKQGDREDLNNYGPILVISVIAKVFERIVYDQLYAHLEKPTISSVNIIRAFVPFTQMSLLSMRPRKLGRATLTAEKSMPLFF